MSQLKYVIFEYYGFCGTETTGIIFNDTLQHSMVGELGDPVAAGFCWQDDDMRWKVGGESTSLKLESRKEEDEKILNRIYGPNRPMY